MQQALSPAIVAVSQTPTSTPSASTPCRATVAVRSTRESSLRTITETSPSLTAHSAVSSTGATSIGALSERVDPSTCARMVLHPVVSRPVSTRARAPTTSLCTRSPWSRHVGAAQSAAPAESMTVQV